MLKQYVANPLLFLLLGGACLSMAPGDEANPPSNNPTVEGVKPGVSDDAKASPGATKATTGKEEIAQADSDYRAVPRDGNFRMGNWDNKENWRYNRDAFYKGETQPEAYRDEHPYGAGGIGYDADVNYSRNVKRYRELHPEQPTPQQYQGNYGEGSYNDAYGDRNYQSTQSSEGYQQQ